MYSLLFAAGDVGLGGDPVAEPQGEADHHQPQGERGHQRGDHQQTEVPRGESEHSVTEVSSADRTVVLWPPCLQVCGGSCS